MSKLSLTLACADYDRTRPLLDGSVQPEGMEIIGIALPPGEIFFRMSRYREFQASEMSLASLYDHEDPRGLSLHRDPGFPIPDVPPRLYLHQRRFGNQFS